MAQHHSEQGTQHYYEGDQSKLYSGVMNHHFGKSMNTAASKKQVNRILKVTLILSVVTIIEVILGMFFSDKMPKGLIVFFFMTLTLLKAGYIVSVFMHLGDELKNFLITVLIPLTLFIWFVIAFLADGSFWLHMNETTPVR